MNNIISLSGGKDSTAMLLHMVELNEQIDEVVFFDTGWEFPPMLKHIDQLEIVTGLNITRLKPERPFNYWLLDRPVKARKGPLVGQVHRIGNGWPSPLRRWCTRIKVNTIERYIKANYDIKKVIMNVGFAADESHRQTPTMESKAYSYRYPLIEWGWNEDKCLTYCKSNGFNWSGLYDVFYRVSCYCCPLQRLSELRKLRKYCPDLWADMLRKDKLINNNIGFHGYSTVCDLEKRFAAEDCQLEFDFIPECTETELI